MSTTFLLALTFASIILYSSVKVVAAAGTCDGVLPPAIIKGKKFFSATTGEYIPIKGINYYPRPNDGELTSSSIDFFTETHRHIWERDIANFVKLNINAIRLYAVDPGLNHDAFFCALKSANIYAIVGLAASCQDCAITLDEAPDCYPAALKERGQFTISQFSKYDNVLAFSAGNEVNLVVPADEPEQNAPCQKQFLRDMRQFILNCPSMRQIPVGIETADLTRELNTLYYACRSDSTDELENTEYFGINVYLHCDGNAGSSTNLLGYQELLENYQTYALPIPVMLTEFGCLNPSFPTIDGYEAQRDFLQVEALFSSTYSEEFAGGFVFEYSTERIFAEPTTYFPFTSYGSGNYGVGYFSPEACDDITINCTFIPFPQFDTLASRYDDVDTSFQPSFDTYSPDFRSVPECPAQFPALSSFDWPVVTDLTCPDPVTVYCPNIPVECLTTPAPVPTAPTMTAPTPVSSPVTTTAATTRSPTKPPTTKAPLSTPTKAPTSSPNKVPSTTPPSSPTKVPSSTPPSLPTKVPTRTPPSSSTVSTPKPSTPAISNAPSAVKIPFSSVIPTSSAVRGLWSMGVIWSGLVVMCALL